MARNKSKGPLPSRSLDELVELFETHDMGEYWEEMPEAQFEIDIKKSTHLVAIDEKLLDQLSKVAKSKHLSAEALIHSWLEEKMLEAS
jgi:hypothetical protein